MTIGKTSAGLLAGLALLLITFTTAFAGGWATFKVNRLPVYSVAGKSVPVKLLGSRRRGVFLRLYLY